MKRAWITGPWQQQTIEGGIEQTPAFYDYVLAVGGGHDPAIGAVRYDGLTDANIIPSPNVGLWYVDSIPDGVLDAIETDGRFVIDSEETI